MSTASAGLEPRWTGIERRLPSSLEELRGPAEGIVLLPSHIAWSGLREYDLANPRLRLSLYRVLLNVGQREDLVRYVNANLLRGQWPVLRRLVPDRLREAWERRFSLPAE